jgi:hypothetical protein
LSKAPAANDWLRALTDHLRYMMQGGTGHGLLIIGAFSAALLDC